MRIIILCAAYLFSLPAQAHYKYSFNVVQKDTYVCETNIGNMVLNLETTDLIEFSTKKVVKRTFFPSFHGLTPAEISRFPLPPDPRDLETTLDPSNKVMTLVSWSYARGAVDVETAKNIFDCTNANCTLGNGTSFYQQDNLSPIIDSHDDNTPTGYYEFRFSLKNPNDKALAGISGTFDILQRNTHQFSEKIKFQGDCKIQ